MKTIINLSLGIFFFILIGCNKDEIVIEKDKFYLLNIEFNDLIPIDEKIEMNLCQTINEESITYEGKIERRGGFSISLPKHSYEIDLNDDISLAELPKDDDWILNANYIDKTFLRHVMSYELFTTMNENNIASKCKYVELKLNGVYNGLYVLMEKLDKSSLKICDEDSNAVIFKEPHIFRDTYEGIIPQNINNFHQQTYPKIEKRDKTAFIEEVREFILTSSDNNFTIGISGIFDIDNLIDWHLLLMISNNSDGILKNFYLYKTDKETPIRIAPWDYDHSFGRDCDNELNLDEYPLIIERSILFRRLLEFDWYKANLKERWMDMNNMNILSENGLKQRVIAKSNFIKELAKKNFEIWPVDNPWYFDSNNFEEEIEIIFKFIELRHNRLRDYFNNL